MLLRRITEHVKAQNWTAVALDFVIVVVGVFIGIQVANWNDARVAYIDETEIIRFARDEIRELISNQEKELTIRRKITSDIYFSLSVLERGVLKDEEKSRFESGLRATGNGLSFSEPNYRVPSFQDPDVLAQIKSRDLRLAIRRHEEAVKIIESRNEASSAMAMEMFTDFTKMFTWQNPSPEDIEGPPLQTWYDFETLTEERALYNRLSIFYGSLLLRANRLSDVIKQNRALVEVFDTELEVRGVAPEEGSDL